MEKLYINNKKGSNTLAAIVSFNGAENTVSLINRLRLMVDCVYVVDNGSSSYSKELLASMSSRSNVEVLFLSENCGIGKALNLALNYARDQKYEWFISFDQDSMPNIDMIEKMFEFQHLQHNCLVLTPQIVSRIDILINKNYDNTIVSYAITSGNMIAVDVAVKVGGYNESYFIDCVDFEFSLRLRQSGYNIYRVGNALMMHGVGEKTLLPKIIKKFYTRHSSSRRYYQHRNLIFILKSYLFIFPGFCIKLLAGQIIQVSILMLVEKNRLKNISNIFLGLRDGILGHKGRLNSDH